MILNQIQNYTEFTNIYAVFSFFMIYQDEDIQNK